MTEITFFYNHFWFNQNHINWINLFYLVYLIYFILAYDAQDSKNQSFILILQLNFFYFVKIFFFTFSWLTFVLTFEILTLLITFNMVYYSISNDINESKNIIQAFFYNFWITFLSSILLFSISIGFWYLYLTYEVQLTEFLIQLNFQFNQKITLINIAPFLFFFLLFFIKIGSAPFLFWKINFFNDLIFEFFIVYFVLVLFPFFIFFIYWANYFSIILVENFLFSFLSLTHLSIFFLSFLLTESQTLISFLVISTGLTLSLVLLPICFL